MTEKRKIGRPKGTPKTGGRKKGTPNKITADTKDWFVYLLNNNRERLEKALDTMDDKELWDTFQKIFPYIVPKMQSMEAKIDFNQFSDEQIDQIINELQRMI
jgi:hypothetical protein